MFLNNISLYSLPFIGIIFLVISLAYSKTIHFVTHQLSPKEKKHQSVNNDTNDSQNLHISIQVNPFENQQYSTVADDDDDDELIKSDLLTNFCETDLIELRLDDNDLTNEIDI